MHQHLHTLEWVSCTGINAAAMGFYAPETAI
jgi:hypothetical protein